MFNTELICRSCKYAERVHPDYDRAVAAERRAVQDGVQDFPGIGLPASLVHAR